MKAFLTLKTWLWLAMVLTVGGVLYISSFSFPFDQPYLLDFYEKSQWNIPQSPRVMSDNELYQVAGIKLLEGDSIFSINPEVPPLGKYIYGLSIKLAGTPYMASVLMFLVLGVAVYGLSNELSQNKNAKLLLVVLLLSSPIVADQVSRTMLDLPMTLFLVLHAWCVTRLLKQKHQLGSPDFKSWGALLGAGVTLGAVAACKVPFFIPVIVLADALFMFRKQWKNLIVMLGVTGLTYVATFTAYFVQGNSPIDWLKAQKWMVNFYLSSTTQHTPFFNLITIATGWYKDWWGQSQWHWTTYWSPVWPAGVVAMIAVLRQSKLSAYRYPAVLGLLMILFQGLQPFWPRYFLLILPFTLICCVPAFEWLLAKKKSWVLGVLALLSMVYGWYFFRLPPDELVFHFNEDWNQGDYQDAYNFITPAAFDRTTFWTSIKEVDAELGLQNRNGTLSYEPVSIFDDVTFGEYNETLNTPLGPVVIQQPVTFERTGGRWRMVWNPAIVLPFYQYQIGDEVTLDAVPVTSGQLRTRDGVLLSEGGTQELVSVDLSQVSDVEPVVLALSEAFGLGGTEIRNRLLVESLPGQQVVFGVLPAEAPTEKVAVLRATPGISVTTQPSSQRQYSEMVRNAQLEDTVRQLEAENPQLLASPSGKVIVIKPRGEQITVLEQTGQAAQNVTLPQTWRQLLAN